MVTSLQIFLGLLIGGAGFLQLGDSPFFGSGMLLLAGFLILAGIDRCNRTKRSSER